jgi:multidrug efflux system outer membrane protein
MAVLLIRNETNRFGSPRATGDYESSGATSLKILSSSVVFLLLAGCISPPKNQSDKLDIDMPESWKSELGGGQFDPNGWIRDFNDPHLASVIEEAFVHNYNLQAAEARLRASIEGSRFAGSNIYPSLTGTTNVNRNRRNNASGISQTPTAETYGINLRFNWEIDLWGRVRNGYKADLADIQSAKATYDATRLSIAGRVAQAWYNAIEDDLQYDLAKRTQVALESGAQIVEENFKRGIARALDVRLVRANVASNQSTLEARMRAKESSARILETLLGRYPANEILKARGLDSESKSDESADDLSPTYDYASRFPELQQNIPTGIPSELLLRRPDIIAAERSLAASEQRKFETSKARIPSLNINLSRGTNAREVEDIIEVMDFRVWSQSATFAQTLFQGGRLRANFRRSKANYEVALANYASSVLTAFREVENALGNQDSFERDYESQKIAAEESAAAEVLAWEEYGRGLTDITTALDAVRRNITAQRGLIGVSNQRIQSRIDLYLSLGGGLGYVPNENESDE